MRYNIKVTQSVPREEVHRKDEEEFGPRDKGSVVFEEDFIADSEESALDILHYELPLAAPENYDIEVKGPYEED